MYIQLHFFLNLFFVFCFILHFLNLLFFFQSVKVSVPIKQEANKGVKRPHSDTTDVPKAVSK